MTNELEKHFFDTFGIKKEINTCEIGRFGRCAYAQPCVDTCPNFRNRKFYPQITDRILLELICILGNTSYFLITDDGLPIDVDGLKKSVLHSLTLQAKIDKNKVLKHQVRTLFEEG